MSKEKRPGTRDLTFFLGLLNVLEDRVQHIRAGGQDVEREVLFLLEMWGLSLFNDAKEWSDDKLRVLKEEHVEQCETYLKEIYRLGDRGKILRQLECLEAGIKGLHRSMYDLTQRIKVQHMQDLSAIRKSTIEDVRKNGHARRPIPTLYEEALWSLEILRGALKNRARVNRAGLRFVRESVKALARKVDAMGKLVYKNHVNLKGPVTRRSKKV